MTYEEIINDHSVKDLSRLIRSDKKRLPFRYVEQSPSYRAAKETSDDEQFTI